MFKQSRKDISHRLTDVLSRGFSQTSSSEPPLTGESIPLTAWESEFNQCCKESADIRGFLSAGTESCKGQRKYGLSVMPFTLSEIDIHIPNKQLSKVNLMNR